MKQEAGMSSYAAEGAIDSSVVFVIPVQGREQVTKYIEIIIILLCRQFYTYTQTVVKFYPMKSHKLS